MHNETFRTKSGELWQKSDFSCMLPPLNGTTYCKDYCDNVGISQTTALTHCPIIRYGQNYFLGSNSWVNLWWTPQFLRSCLIVLQIATIIHSLLYFIYLILKQPLSFEILPIIGLFCPGLSTLTLDCYHFSESNNSPPYNWYYIHTKLQTKILL